jgi:hypothetical protein
VVPACGKPDRQKRSQRTGKVRLWEVDDLPGDPPGGSRGTGELGKGSPVWRRSSRYAHANRRLGHVMHLRRAIVNGPERQKPPGSIPAAALLRRYFAAS